nr:immunoglobulin heavy chain junction region [Macaca mulatta]MOX91620.1 immunoglobulin heavy chain junction region [Macaca mulatta]MOX91732.1 immunoglobulin heavy chain junction region [Macaca mulatta]MOX91766.1 immunoglobulin heavy chain junction region [Macaca mulatta]MOX91953.1 immunoglobulin heavy chain junction region [Macaca mulatta]
CAKVDNEDDYGFYYTWGPLDVW